MLSGIIPTEQIEAIVAGELAYCDTLNLFD